MAFVVTDFKHGGIQALTSGRNRLSNPKTFRFGLAAAFLLASAPALAQVYSWKDPATGQGRLSNFAPPWYSRGELVSGPRVVASVGDRVIDDTALPYEDRLLLFGKPKDQGDRQRLEKQPGAATAPEESRRPDRPQATNRLPVDKTARRGQTAANNGS